MTTNGATVKVLGTTDKIGTCDCCERTDLKKTVMLDLGNGLVHFGVGCAARALKMDEKDVRKAASSADRETKAAAKKATRAANMAAFEEKLRARQEACRRARLGGKHIAC